MIYAGDQRGDARKDIHWVRENAKSFACVVEDLSDAYTQLAIQGPRAIDVMTEADGRRTWTASRITGSRMERSAA